MPGKPCTICSHPKIAQINEDIRGNVSLRAIGERYDVCYGAVYRHRDSNHHNTIEKPIEYDKEITEEVQAEIEDDIKETIYKTEFKSSYDKTPKEKELLTVINVSKKMIRRILREAKSKPDVPNQYYLVPHFLKEIRESVKVQAFLDYQPLQIEAKRVNSDGSSEQSEQDKKWLEKLVNKSRSN